MRLTLILFFISSFCYGGEIDYNKFYTEYNSGKSVVVIVSAGWCGACQTLETQLRKSEAFDISFIVVDVDKPFQQSVLDQNYDRKEGIPQIVVWTKATKPIRIGNVGVQGIRELVSRNWTDSSGQYQRKANFVSLKNGIVHLLKPDGGRIHIEYDSLGIVDKRFILGSTNENILA